MACATQSAVDYIKCARMHLVGKLNNLSVILENLNQQRVLSDEEVSNIEAEKQDFNKTRRILDSVIRKGEAASYEFLRILDETRSRSSGRAIASTEPGGFNLHHWISCFSFNEETQMDTNYIQGPCHQYQAKLKSKARKISDQFWIANTNLFNRKNKPELSYMTLVLDKEKGPCPSKVKTFKSKKSKKSHSKKLRTYIPEDKAEPSPSDLLKTDKNILLVGKPGIGKTALTHEILKLWAERDNKELDYMFYFDMRETSHIMKALSLEDLLFTVFSEPDEGKEEVLQDIKKNSESVTLIFDGITDLSSSVVKRLIERDLLPDAKVILTCRPDDEGEIPYDDKSDVRVEVKGFSEKTIKAYLSAMLDEEQKVLSNTELLTLCHVPIYALMVAACLSFETPEDSLLSCSITEIYINIVRHCLQVNSKTKSKDLNSFIKSKRNEILSLAEVAFHATEGRTVNLAEFSCEESCVLSFLKTLPIKVAPTKTKTMYAFLHYTVQEFFAALWLLKNPNRIKDVFQQCLTEEKKHMKHLIPFMCRLLTEESFSLMKCLIPAQELKQTSDWFFKEVITTFLPCPLMIDETDVVDSQPDVDILFLCHCLYESQCPEACIYLLDKLDYHLDLSGESLDPFPCCAVAYVVSQSKERKIRLDLENVMVSEQGMRQLFGCLKNVQWRDPLPRQLWELLLLSEGKMDPIILLSLDGNQLHLPVGGKRQLFERAADVMQKLTTNVNVCLHWERETAACQSLCKSLLEALPYISSLTFNHQFSFSDEVRFIGSLISAATERKEQTMEEIPRLISQVLRTFPPEEKWCLLLDLCSHLKDYETKTGQSVLPLLQSVFQSAPAVWTIDLSERKTSIILAVLKLQSEKKPVELTGWSDEESEVSSFLQCLPYISQLSVFPRWSNDSKEIKIFMSLISAAAEREQQTGEKILELISSVCRYKTFPLQDLYRYGDDKVQLYRSDFLLDLYSHLKDYETKTGQSVLPSLQSVFQSAPAVWTIDLSERKTSILLTVLKLQSEKKPVKLRGWSDEESEVSSFLQCLPYISQLSCDPDFFQDVCSLVTLRSRVEVEQLSCLLQLLGFFLPLTGHLSRKTCRSVGAVLRLCGSEVDLILKPRKMSVRGASLLLRGKTQLHSLRLSTGMALLLCRWVRRRRLGHLVTIDKLSVSPQTAQPSQGVFLKLVSGLASLLRHWTVRQLDLTEVCGPAQDLIPLLLHGGPLTIKLSEKTLQQLLSLLHEIQDRDLTWFFFSKVGGDLTSCCLNWELLHYLLQQTSAQVITVNLRKNRFLRDSVARLLPFLDRIVFKGSCPSFVLTAIREVYRARAGPVIPSLLRSLDDEINLNCREMDSVDCAALLFTLQHSDGVKLTLLWTSTPAGETESILFMLDKVSQLSVDRNLLLRLVHCCAASEAHQGAAVCLLRALQHRLDLSWSSCLDLDQSDAVSLTRDDCRALCTILKHSSQDTELILQDCEVEDSGLDLLFPVLHRVRLRAGKAVLLQLVSLVAVSSERDTMRRAGSLCRALGGELDLSHTTLVQRACGALALVLDFSEGLAELDLSHCQLTDQLLLTLSTHLHKVQVLDLSHNNITDASTHRILQLLSINPCIETVRLFRNNIVDRAPFMKDKRFEM